VGADPDKPNDIWLTLLYVMEARFQFTIFALLMTCLPLQCGAVELAANSGNSIRTLSRATLRSIFTMRMTEWPDGTPVRVFVLGDKVPLHVEFTKQVLGVFPHQLRRAWNRRIYSGTGQAPIRVGSEAEMYLRLSVTPGAIGYLSEGLVDGEVRTIEIE
jgi:ABC-type phosphate transport system substrate-binding protein